MVFVVLKNILREKLRVFVDRMRICGIRGECWGTFVQSLFWAHVWATTSCTPLKFQTPETLQTYILNTKC